jgi:hypothetical protein
MSKETYGKQEAFTFGNDPIVIRVYGKSIVGGRKLDVTGFTGEYIRKGMLVLRDTDDTHSIPMPLNEAGTECVSAVSRRTSIPFRIYSPVKPVTSSLRPLTIDFPNTLITIGSFPKLKAS